jgi:thiamine pyrophosphate-dependent acetolactate synthase large subunit-like protein
MRFQVLTVFLAASSFAGAQRSSSAGGAPEHHSDLEITWHIFNILSEVRFEQEERGNPPYGCDLGPIDFVAFAKACGADGFRCATAAEVGPALCPALSAALRSPKAAIVEAVVDPEEASTKAQEVRV